jgi:hypothetical protein
MNRSGGSTVQEVGMLFEIGSMVIATFLSLSGVGMPGALITEPATQTPAACSSIAADSCLENDACDVFISAGGSETCGVACDLRSLDSCASDGACEVRNGVCDYPDYSPVGC